MARESAGCCPGPMAMEREVNEVPAKLKQGPGEGSKPGELAMEREVNPVPSGIKNGRGGSSRSVGGFHTRSERGKTFKERREEARGRR